MKEAHKETKATSTHLSFLISERLRKERSWLFEFVCRVCGCLCVLCVKTTVGGL